MTLILALRRHDSCDDTLARELTGPGLSSADKGGARLAVMPAQRTVIRINRSVNLHGGGYFSFFSFFFSFFLSFLQGRGGGGGTEGNEKEEGWIMEENS